MKVVVGIEDPNTSVKKGHHRPAREMPLLAGKFWPNIKCWLGSFVIFQGIWISIAKKPYIFVIVQGGGEGDWTPSGPPMFFQFY